ncbi:MAG: arylsulfatase A-like enzyme [Bacteroidia bacterium]|jgi:arylsulfatase A-like enzyme
MFGLEGRRAPWLGYLVIGALPLGLAACGEGVPTLPDPAPLVLWIEVDTLRADALGCYGAGLLGPDSPDLTPNLDALAAEGLRFDAAYSTAPWTLPSLASAFTGKWPWDHGTTRLLSKLGQGHVTIAERLQDAGYSTAGVMTNFVATAAYGFDQGFDLWDDSLALGHQGSTSMAATRLLLAQYDELAKGDQPIFLFELLFEPHWRYEVQPGLVVDADPEGRMAKIEDIAEARRLLVDGSLSSADLAELRTLYAGEVAQVDAAIGVLIDGLKQRGVWDDTLVIFTADHGELLGEEGWIGHTKSLSDELVRVPLIWKLPKSKTQPKDELSLADGGRVVSTPVSQVDLHSTLLELVGAPAQNLHIPSRSFADLLRGPGAAADFQPREDLFLHVDFEPLKSGSDSLVKRTHKWGVVKASDGTKWTVDHLAPGGPKGLLVDPTLDVDEAVDLSGDRTELELAEYWRLEGLVPRALGTKTGGDPR